MKHINVSSETQKRVINKRFNLLTVTTLNQPMTDKKGRAMFDAKCKCGKVVKGKSIGLFLYDAIYSCGCERRPIGKKKVKHLV